MKNFVKNNNYLYTINSGRIITFNLEDKEISEIEIELHPENNNIRDFAFYNNNLYILDDFSNQIYKYNAIENYFSSGNTWINNENNIQKASSLTIDGNIYISQENGNLKRFYSGSLQEFKIEDIDPKIENINKIYTDRSINEIYIMDNISKTIIIINKEGSLIAQYYFPTIESMDDFLVDGAAQKIYILSENKIVSLNLN